MKRPLLLGALLYSAAATFDTCITLYGLGGDPTLEGNPFVRWTMVQLNPSAALVLQKGVLGLLLVAIAAVTSSAIKQDSPWLDRIPSLLWVKAWFRRRRPVWIAYLPLYLVALFQLLAGISWLILLRG